MLSPADAELVSRDPELPGLALLLDPEAVAEQLADSLPDSAIQSATPTYLRYKVATNCLVAYRIRSASGEVLAYAKAHGRDAADKLEKVRGKRQVGGALGTGTILLNEPGVVFHLFPNDAKLPLLRRLDEPGELRRLLERALEDHSGLWDARVTPLRYKPERRFVGRLDAPDGERAALRVYGEDDFVSASNSARRLGSRGRLRLARRIGVSKGKRVIVTEWLPGESLALLLYAAAASSANLDSALASLGAALFELHSQSEVAAKLPAPSAASLGAALAAAAELLGFLCPARAEHAQSLAREIGARQAREIGELSAEPAHALHGDFHPDQVLLAAGGEIALLDLDLAQRGPAQLDLANFSAHLLRDVACERIPAARAHAAQEALAAGYSQASGHAPGALGVWRAASLLRLAAEPFRQRDPRWPERCAAILDAAQAALGSESASLPAARAHAGSRAESVPASPSPSAAAPTRLDDPGLPLLPAALDVRAMELRLAPLLCAHAPAALRLAALRVLRHRPGRRALIEYEVLVPPPTPGAESQRISLLGKHRRRGLDQRTPAVMRALRERGLRLDTRVGSEASVGVAEPLGEIPELHLWLQRRVPGQVASELLPGAEGAALAARIGAGIARLHAAQVFATRRHEIGRELAILRERLELVAAEQASWRPRAARIADACERLGGRLPSPSWTGIHRDFYADQVVVDGPRIALVDLDLFAAGDPALDAGNFLAHVSEQSLREHGDPLALADREAAFLDAYLANSPGTDANAVRAYALLSLARLLQVSRRIPERNATTEALFDLIETRLDLARRPRVA